MPTQAGQIVGVYLGAQKGAAKQAVARAQLLAGHGLDGDSHAGRDAARQVSLFAAEVLRELQAEGFNVTAEDLSVNLFVAGVALDALPAGARLRVGETLLEIVEQRQPCHFITRLDKRLPKRLYGRCGQLGRVLASGWVRAGDLVEVLGRADADE
jgi:MOSC domain-containing protein YiiM